MKLKKMVLLIIVSSVICLVVTSPVQSEESLGSKTSVVKKLTVEKNYIHKELIKVNREKDALVITVRNLKERLGVFNHSGKDNSSAFEDLILQKKSLIRQITNIRQEKIILNGKIKSLE
ncbi:MAG: translation initiation factor 2B subunit (eIF-2B alpha/beta/delta family), partial [Candidatus Omnitrophota bacterium]